MKYLYIFIFLSLSCPLVLGQCDTISKASIQAFPMNCYFAPSPATVNKMTYIEPSDCKCYDCFCYTIFFTGTTPECFAQHYTIIGSKRTKVKEVFIDAKQSKEYSLMHRRTLTVVHIKFTHRNRKKTIDHCENQETQRHLKFRLIDKITKEIYLENFMKYYRKR